MRRERGFDKIDIALGIVVFLLIAGAVLRVYESGVAAKQLEWDAANRRAEQLQRSKETAVAKEIMTADEKRETAEQKAKDSETKRQEAIREARRNSVALAVCEQAAQPAATADRGAVGSGIRAPENSLPAGGASPAPRIRLTWELVRELDTAWTGLDGKPVSSLAAGLPGPAGAGASPYALEDLRDVAGENAKRCSEDRRELATLRVKLQGAADAWDRTR